MIHLVGLCLAITRHGKLNHIDFQIIRSSIEDSFLNQENGPNICWKA